MTIDAAAQHLIDHRPGWRPHVALLLGSGLGGLVDLVEDPTSVDYSDLPGFPRPSVAGHAGRLVAGAVGGVPVAVLSGRVHSYEGGDVAGPLKTLVRTLKAIGAEILVLTNAAGSLRPEVGPGRLVAIADHMNFLGFNPLTGPNDDRWGPRFPPMGDAYDPALRLLLKEAAAIEQIDLPEGVYLAYPGPNFETSAEIRAFRTLGADLVGMSTVPEVLIARHCGLRVAGLSVVTNLAQGLAPDAPSHGETLAAAAGAAADAVRLIRRFLTLIPR